MNMNIKRVFTSLKSFEIVFLIVFIVLTVLPIRIPANIANYIDNPLSVLFFFVITTLLFIYFNPLLGIVYIVFVYELFRRCDDCKMFKTHSSVIEITPTVQKPTATKPEPKTLEEEVIAVKAPIGKAQPVAFVETDFKPINDKIIDGSSLYSN